MAIKLNILERPPIEEKIIYKDINLKMSVGFPNSTELSKNNLIQDLKTSDNLDAIRNSLINLISTSPGQKILNPQFGISFGDLLFLPVSRERGEVIAQTILTAFKKYESRVNIVNFDIVANIELQQYTIDITYNVPAFDYNPLKLKGDLDKTGFYV
jgi:phage baseplate assembly protein W